MVRRTVLITGGLGYLGGNLSNYLKNLGYQVVIGTSRGDATLPRQLKNCPLIHIDLKKIKNLTDACSNVDFVVHLASLNAMQSEEDYEVAIKINGIGTYNLIQASIKNNIKYFLYFSTAHVYRSPLTGKIDEHTLPKPNHSYAISHRLAEDFLLEAIQNKDIKGNVLRLSNSIGLPITKEVNCWMLFINDACKQAIVNKQIVINSNPYSKRDFISIDAVCEITENFLLNQTTSNYPIYNVGSGISISLLSVAEKIVDRCEKLFGFSPKINYSKNYSHINIKLDYKIDKLKNEFDYVAISNINSSIDKILKFCMVEFG